MALGSVPVEGQVSSELWRSHVELGFNGSSGNTSFSILTFGASLTRLDEERFEFETSGQLRYGTSDGATIANDMRGSLKFDWMPDADISPFVFTTASKDEIRNLDARLLGGGGAKWTFWRGVDASKASFSLAGVLDYENFDLAPGSTEPETKRVGRWSARFKFDYAFGGGATYQHITFWQPKVDDAGDYLVDMANSLSTRLLSNLSLVLRHEYLHDEIPPPGADPDDQRLSIVLRVSL